MTIEKRLKCTRSFMQRIPIEGKILDESTARKEILHIAKEIVNKVNRLTKEILENCFSGWLIVVNSYVRLNLKIQGLPGFQLINM